MWHNYQWSYEHMILDTITGLYVYCVYIHRFRHCFLVDFDIRITLMFMLNIHSVMVYISLFSHTMYHMFWNRGFVIEVGNCARKSPSVFMIMKTRDFRYGSLRSRRTCIEFINIIIAKICISDKNFQKIYSI